MNLLVIGTTDILGGAAKISWELKSELEARGDSVSMFVTDKRSNDPAVKVIPRQKWRKYASLLLASDNFEETDWLLETPQFKEADVIHCHNLHGRYFNLSTLEKISSQKPVVWTLHDEWAITPHCAYTLEGTKVRSGLYVCPSLSTQPRLLWNNTKRLATRRTKIYRQAKMHIVSPSHWLAERVENTILQTQPLTIIPNGIDTTTFTKTDQRLAREKLGLPLDKKIVMFLAVAGKANTWKGWKYTETVISHLQDQDDILFLNVGNLTGEVSTEGNVVYRPKVQDPAELALYYSAADVLLFTSVAENFPLVILEAMSCGLPIVSFDVGGVTEVVTHQENGYIAPYLDTEELHKGIDWALTLPIDVREKLARASSEKIKQSYTTEHMVEQYFALYDKVIKSYDDHRTT